MFFMLIATFAAGVVAAGVVLAIPRLFGKRASRHAPPLAAGLAMFAFMLWNEYSWFDRTLEGLPGDVRVAATYEHSSVLQPWTLIAPRVNRFAAVQMATAKRNPDFPDQMLADVLLLSRFEDTARRKQVFDCAARRRADVPLDGASEGWSPDWADVSENDPLLRAACDG